MEGRKSPGVRKSESPGEELKAGKKNQESRGRNQESGAKSQDLEGADSVVKKSQEPRVKNQDLGEKNQESGEKNQESRAKSQDLEEADSAPGTLHSEIEHPTSEIEHLTKKSFGPTSEIKNKSEPDSYRVEHLPTESFGPASEIQNTSEPDSYWVEHPKSDIQNTSEIKPMEVHHHPEVEKKGIKEYLLEGLMIFLAVMMGFFAESLREHINEQQQARDYAANLYQDMKEDTLELHSYLGYFKFANANADTLMQLLADKDPRQIPAGKLYYFGLFGGAYHIFTPHDATLLTMKSSGALRFFGDKTISRKLAVYDELCQNMKLNEEKENGIYVQTRVARAKIFEYKYNEEVNAIYHEMPQSGATTGPHGEKIVSQWAKVDSFKKTNPPLLSYDQTLFNEYVEMVRSRFLGLKVAEADTLLHHSSELMRLLRRKYEVEKE